MFRALGLDTLKAKKEYFSIHVRKLSKLPVSKEVQEFMQFQNGNEINAIFTLSGLIMPNILPSCHSFLEVGPQFIHGVHRENLIEVSRNGIIKCTNGEACEFKQRNLIRHKK